MDSECLWTDGVDGNEWTNGMEWLAGWMDAWVGEWVTEWVCEWVGVWVKCVGD